MAKYVLPFFLWVVFTFLISFTVFTASNKVKARNIPNDIGNPINFGQILGATIDSKEPIKENKRQESKINSLLDRLLASSRESLTEFENNQKKSQPLITNDQLPITTPYIPIPTLLAGVSDFLASPTPTFAPKLERVLAAETNQKIRDQLSGISNEVILGDNQQLTTNNTSTSLRVNNRAINNTGNLIENPIRTTYVLAVLGDSMVDTLGSNLPDLKDALKLAYSNYTFALLNYGQGSTDLENGLYRLTNASNYLGRYYPPLLSYNPDILVVESFAYNHWSGEKHDLDRQWLTFAKIVDTVKDKSPNTKIVFATTIGPNSKVVGDGVLNWPKALKSDYALVTKAYLQNLINFATSQHFPLADAYSLSLNGTGEGKSQYINAGNNLHPSAEGARLFAEKIVEAISINKLIE